MTAGTGIMHSEFNPSEAEPVHLYQIWLFPERRGLRPSYEQKSFPVGDRTNQLRLVASPDGRDGSLVIRQDARLFLASLTEGSETSHSLGTARNAWLQVLRGGVELNGTALAAGDGASATDESNLSLRALEAVGSFVVRSQLRFNNDPPRGYAPESGDGAPSYKSCRSRLRPATVLSSSAGH